MRWRISYSPAAAERSTLGMRLTVCPTLNLCITILSILISGCYISLARAAKALSKSAHSVGFLLIILDREETARGRPATEAFAAPSAQLGGAAGRPCRATWNRLASISGRGPRAGPPLPWAPGTTRGFIGSRPSRCIFLRASLRARRIASAFSRVFFSGGFS
jgi:hypothetical protein